MSANSTLGRKSKTDKKNICKTAQTYDVQFLDTKYVLDGNGIMRWIDIKPLDYSNIKPILGPLL
jgi:hypothetical protein